MADIFIGYIKNYHYLVINKPVKSLLNVLKNDFISNLRKFGIQKIKNRYYYVQKFYKN
jgi:hypothetical protein